ncbi:DUF6673 family protein [Romboutsia sp. 1001713B170207_170306_H8]|uniref:DUF6673 family protein n=1 Tax=Romboutsia sp. 1001713B170207_170306_H8 TaxID=2787112 RepID=UPI00189B03CF|nr:DUF6673 family protein [Romboutsia sp. 1001713B170207_170306_H8]
MKINGVELQDLDIYDIEVAEKYEQAMNTLTGLDEKVKNLNGVESIRAICTLIFDVFNTMFGEGTDKKIFGNKVNLITCIKALEEFQIQMNDQKKEIEKLFNKYSPNRAARRSKK